jgi:TonB family protein
VKRFWGNVVLIALAHVALIGGLIHWSAAAKPSSNPENVIWLGDAAALSADEPETRESHSPKQPTPEDGPSRPQLDETAGEKAVVPNVKSEIELPPTTPKPTATARPAKPAATPALKTRIIPTPSSKPTRRKTVLAKDSQKISAKPKSSPAKAKSEPEKKDKIILARKESASPREGGQSGSSGKSGKTGGGTGESEFGWYGSMLHDRFYSAWIQPTMKVPSGTKLSTVVNVRIEKDGRISKFEIAKPSANATVNESVAAVAKQVSQVDPPPTALFRGDHYDVKINFELNTQQAEIDR